MTPMVLFQAGSIPVYADQALLWAGILLCLTIACRAMRKQGYAVRNLLVFAPLTVFLGFASAHVFYCLVRLEHTLYDAQAISFLYFWDDHDMLYGGMVGCALAALVAAKGAHRSTLGLLDAIAPAGALMIAFVRLAQGLHGDGYGEYLDDGSVFAHFPFAVFDAYYEAWAWALFLLAALVAVLLFIWIGTRKSRFAGDRTLLFVGLYAAAQIVLESLRRDDFLRWGFVRSSQLISVILVGFVLVCYALPRFGQPLWRKLTSFTLYGGMVAMCVLLEFALEQRIAFLQELSTQACYGLMAFASLLLMVNIGMMRGVQVDAKQHKQAPKRR